MTNSTLNDDIDEIVKLAADLQSKIEAANERQSSQTPSMSMTVFLTENAGKARVLKENMTSVAKFYAEIAEEEGQY